ncbi:MAG: TonB-dependent receptor [Caldimonas sp.]
MSFKFKARLRPLPFALALLGAGHASLLHAQTTLAPVVVTGNPVGSTELASPVTVLSGDELVLRRGSSLGETLKAEPGVSTTYFGPNANRPVIRGLDGDRVLILSNAGASFDASSLSFDHAVPIDPLVVERIEVLRGPGALLYGGSAVGGVVNAIDNRVPKYSLSGVSGAAELRLGGAESERGGAALVEAGNGAFAFHADVFGRKTSDLVVPRYTPVEADGTVLDPTRRIRNSAAQTEGGSIGGSATFRSGYVGTAVDTYDSRYGTVAEQGVTIHMKRDHLALAGEVRDLGGLFRTVRAQINDTRYQHEEIDGTGAIGTTFKTRGTDLRVEAEHAPIGPFKGVLGAQVENVSFSALGEEAFVPTTATHRRALFLVEAMATPFGTLNAGLRVERVGVSSAGDADPVEPRFGPAAERRFTLQSASIGDVYKLTPDWSLSGTFSSSARAPTSFELFADGVHAATGAYERGDSTLGIERGNNVDVALQWKSGHDHLRLGAFAARFSRFISLEASGATFSAPGNGGAVDSFPEYVFKPVRASLRGIEFEGGHRLVDRGWTLDVTARLDATRATDLDSGQPLPRIAPLRARIGFEAGRGDWRAGIELEHAARQNRVPADDVATAGYDIVNLSLSRRVSMFGADAFWFVKADNLGDKLAYSASTVETIRGLVPLPGRAVKTGIRVSF